MIKVSNETKVGALAAVAITLLILGFNFLKGRSVLKTGNFLYARYADAKSIMVSNPVYVNGFQIGTIYDIETEGNDLHKILITIKLNSNYDIPVNSIASVKSNVLGTPSVEIDLGDSKSYLHTGDTLNTVENAGLMEDITKRFDPIAIQLKTTMHSLDTVLKNMNSIFDPTTKGNLQEVIANINKVTSNLVVTSVSLEKIMNSQTGTLNKSLENVQKVTQNLADNNGKVTTILTNVEKTTNNLSRVDLEGTVNKLKSTIDQMNGLMNKINSSNGSVGMLLNDKALYNNLNNTIRSANILLDDLRVHPKRYVNISVFGKKDKTGPLRAPDADSAKH